MKIKVIKSEQDYNEASDRIYKLINSSENQIEPNTSEGEELELLSLLVEKYEQAHYLIEAPGPIEAIKFRMDQMNLKQIDIAPLFGGITRVSEVLHGKRALTLRMITLLNRYLGIPLESLVGSNKAIKLDAEKQLKLLKIPAINEYLKSGNNLSVV